MSFGSTLRKRRKELGLTLDEVAEATGFSKPYLSTIETRRVKYPPSNRLISRLEKVLKVEAGAFRQLANVERMPAEMRRDYEAIDAENRHYKQILQNIIQHNLKPSKLEEVLAGYDLDAAGEKGIDRAGSWVPVINKVIAGYPVDFDDMGYPVGVADDYVRCPNIRDPNAFAVRIVGDSMTPKFKEGDIVVFSPAADVQNGDDCFVRFRSPHETTFKRVYFEGKDKSKIRLQPRNSKYPAKTYDGKRINGVYRAAMHFQAL